MTLLVVGLSHHSAPGPMLETFAALDGAAVAVEALTGPHVVESMTISTCNRFEMYAEVDRFHAGVEDIVAVLAKASGFAADDLTSVCYVHYDERAVHHLFEVSAGLNSMVVGEAQILGQVRAALTTAQEHGTAGRELNEVGQAALRVGKRVRSSTGIDRAGANVVTVGYAEAFERLAAMSGPEPSGTEMLIVGAGALSGLAVALAGRRGVARVTIVSRTDERADRLARSHAAHGASLADLPALLAEADVVVGCTGAQGTVISEEDVRTAMRARPDRPMVLLDLAVPHDTEAGAALVPNVARIDLEMLADRPEAHADHADTIAAQHLVSEELDDFVTVRAARAVEPVLVGLRARGSEVVEAELRRLRDRLPGLAASEWALIEQSLRRSVNTLMHTPTVRIKELASDPDGQRYADAISSLFDLTVDQVDQVLLPREPTTPRGAS